jgi:hypothetical protein
MKLMAEGMGERMTAWLDSQRLSTLLLLTYLLSLFLALAVGYSFSYRSAVEALDYDEWEYWQLSTSLLNGAFDDPGRRTLGYPAILAALRLVSDDVHFVQPAVSALAATAPPLLAFALLRVGAGRLAATLAGIVLAFWPPHLFLAASLYSEAAALPVLLLLLAFLPKGERARTASFAVWLVCGVLLGLLAHIRTMYQLFLPVILVILLFEGVPWKRAVAGWAMVAAGFFLAVLPWSFYVSGKTGAPVLLTANGGETLAGGLTPKLFELEGQQLIELENRTTWVGPGKWIPAGDTGYLTPAEMKLPYAEQDRLLRQRVVQWIADNPGDAAHFTMRKLAYQWGIYPFARQGTLQIVAGNLPILALLILTIASLTLQATSRAIGARFYLMPLFVIGIAIISWGSWRFRHPADAAMLGIVAVAAAAWLQQGLRRMNQRVRTIAAPYA